MKTYLEKRLKIRERDLKYDFLSSMLEIIERPQNPMANVILFLIVELIATAILWAKFSYVDITVTSYGVVLPEDGLVEIKSLYGGNVAEVNVRDGDLFLQNQISCRLIRRSSKLQKMNTSTILKS